MKRFRGLFPLVLAAALAFPIVASAALKDPLGTGGNIYKLIGRLIQGLLGLSGILALVMVVWGGILWITSMGNADRIQQGRTTLLWAAVGLVLLFGAYAAVNQVFDLLTQA